MTIIVMLQVEEAQEDLVVVVAVEPVQEERAEEAQLE